MNPIFYTAYIMSNNNNINIDDDEDEDDDYYLDNQKTKKCMGCFFGSMMIIIFILAIL